MKSQVLTCDDFKEGVFIITLEEFSGVEWKLIKNSGNQVETVEKCPEFYKKNGFPLNINYGKYTQIDQCSYRVLYDEDKMYLNEFQKNVNKNGGIFTKLIKVESNCAYFESIYVFNGKESKFEGKFCKVE
jgi:hypothetical protein